MHSSETLKDLKLCLDRGANGFCRSSSVGTSRHCIQRILYLFTHLFIYSSISLYFYSYLFSLRIYLFLERYLLLQERSTERSTNARQVAPDGVQGAQKEDVWLPYQSVRACGCFKFLSWIFFFPIFCEFLTYTFFFKVSLLQYIFIYIIYFIFLCVFTRHIYCHI